MGWTIFVLIVWVCVACYLAEQFSEVAAAKGYHSKKYFWICFLLELPGWLLVMALPDRGQTTAAVSDELPEL